MIRHLFWTGFAGALLLTPTGCSPLDLGDAPFLCNNGTPKCPTGYACKVGVCVREGQSYLPVDSGPGGKKDGPGGKLDGPGGKLDGPGGKLDGPGGKLDGPGGKLDGPVIKKDTGTTGPTNILITEFMANPLAVSDTNGEWVELFNPTNVKVNINGWTLKDKGVDSQKIAHTGPLYVPANGFLILGRSTDKGQNGGVSVAYAYGAFFLSNASDEVILENEKGQVIDSFTYGPSLTIPVGASLSVKSPGSNKNLPASWCTEATAWPGSTGDKGTPLGKTGCK